MKTILSLRSVSLYRRLLATGVSFCTLALLTGCFETVEEFTLNPDGSGKVVHESSFQNTNLSADEDKPDEALKEAIAKIIEQSKGVEVWRDVSYKRLDDGRLYFKGTAYFKNLSKLDLANRRMLEFDWTNTATGGGVLTLRTNKSDDEKQGMRASKKKVDLAGLSSEERTKKIKEERAKFQQAKPMMSGILGSMKHSASFRLPGQLGEHPNFTAAEGGKLRLEFAGDKMFAAMEKLVNDDAWFEKNINSVGGTETPLNDAEVTGMLFGTKAPVRATVTGASAPLFNYAAEVAAAKVEFAKIQKQLGASPAILAAPAQSAEIKSVKVVGVRLVSQTDKAREVRPFNYDEGYTLALLAELPGSVLAITDKSGLDTAIADDGSDLLPDDHWKGKFHFPKLTKDKSGAVLEVQLLVPGPGVKGLKEISGHLQYNVATATKEVDLGLEELKAGNAGTELGAKIESIEEGWKKDGSQQMRLRLKINEASLKTVYLVVDGAKTELDRRGWSGGGNSASFELESKTAFPVKARLIVEIYDQMQTFNAPFKLENISLLGAPLK